MYNNENQTFQIQDSRNFNFTIVDNGLIEDEGLDIYTKMTYIVLCKYANPLNGNTCFPSYQTIAKKVGCGRTKAIETIQILLKKGYIVKQNRMKEDNNNENTSNLYCILGYKEDVATVSGGVVRHTNHPSSPHALGVVRHTNPNKTNINNTNITTTTGVKNNADIQKQKLIKNNNGVSKNLNSVSNKTTTEFKNKIEKTIGTKINKIAVKELLQNFGEDKVNTYIANWDKFKTTSKSNVVGFFRKAVEMGYDIPKSDVAQNDIPQHVNFDQRDASEIDYDKYYFKVGGEVKK